MNLLPDVYCSEVELLEIRLHRLHEGENAGSLLGTRMQALFLQHCRRRDYSALRGATWGCLVYPVIYEASFEPCPNEASQGRVGFELLEECIMVDVIKASFQIGVQDIFFLVADI